MTEKEIQQGVIFITQDSNWTKWAIDKYAFQMIRELQAINISCSVLPVIWKWGVLRMFLEHLLLPLFTSWKLFFCKEKIIYLHYDFFANFIFLLPFLFISKLLFGKKVIVQIHEYWENLPYKYIIKIVDLSYCLVANKIIIHNNEQFKTLKNYGFNNLEFLHMPVDNYLVIWDNLRDKEKINILMHGAIIRKKWYETWLKALTLLPEKFTLTLIWWVWDSEYFHELLNIVKKSKLEKRVMIIDRFLPENEYEDFIKAADIIIYPYLISTASAALAEWALKFEKPFLTSNLDSFTDYIWTSDYSFQTWDYKDLSKKLLNINLEKALQLSIELKQKYNWNKVGWKLLNIFNSL